MDYFWMCLCEPVDRLIHWEGEMVGKYRLIHCLILSVLLVFISAQVFAHEWMAPVPDTKVKNPVKFEIKSVTEGEGLFMDNCAACHGKNATGLKPEKTGLQKNTPNLIKRLASHSDGDFFWKIRNGREEMPSFKDSLSEIEIWHLINFVKSKSQSDDFSF